MCSSLIHILGFLNVNGYPVSHRSVERSCDTMFIYPSTYSFSVTYSQIPTFDNPRLTFNVTAASLSNCLKFCMCTLNKKSVSYSSLMKCTWHSSILEMKANALPCPPRPVSSHWFLARHLLTPAKVQMQFKGCVGTRFWHDVVNSPRQWMSSQVVYSNSEMYFLFQLTSRLLVKLSDRG